jgi:hypothetical protein
MNSAGARVVRLHRLLPPLPEHAPPATKARPKRARQATRTIFEEQ